MLQFLKFTLATFLGLVLFFAILFWILTAFLPKDEVFSPKPNSVLKLSFSQPILEREVDNPLADFDIPFQSQVSGLGLLEIRAAIQKAKDDKNIKGIFLHLSSVGAGFATLEEIRNTLLDFKKSKKFIYAYGEVLSEGAYYLASVADKIYLNPAGGMEFNGLTSERSFYKGALEKLEVKAEVFRVGEYKSAVEPLLLDKMSEANRKQTESYLNSLYGFYLKNVAESRKISVEELNKISKEYLVQQPEDALKYKLITHIGYYDEVEAALKKELKIKEKDKIEFVALGEYQKAKDTKKSPISENKIAVIFASGEIQSGKGGDDIIGSETIASEIRKARLDEKVKAIVLRINSPGGSALASDVMWREVEQSRKVKPIIASMSDVAASGGYYMAMACEQIVAQPNTITGSIGIFGMLFNLENFYKNKLGITSDRVSTGNFAEIRSALLERSLSETERKLIQASVEKGYADFTSKAAKGRKMSLEKLQSLASGRVWSGAEAKANGLVDVLGGFEDAIKIAAQKAKLKEGEYRLRYLPAQKSFFDRLMEGFQTKSHEKIIKEKLGELYPYTKLLDLIKNQDYKQARLPFDLVIR